MLIGELDLDWAEQDPDYLARIKSFLVSSHRIPPPDEAAAKPTCPSVSLAAELGLE